MSKLAPDQVPPYRCHTQSGRAIVTLGNRDFLLGPYGSNTSRAEYDCLIAEWVANGRQLRTEDGGSAMRVSTLILHFLEHGERYDRGPDGNSCGVWCRRRSLRP